MSRLQALNLGQNLIGDSTMRVMADALIRNRSLRELDLAWNNVQVRVCQECLFEAASCARGLSLEISDCQVLPASCFSQGQATRATRELQVGTGSR